MIRIGISHTYWPTREAAEVVARRCGEDDVEWTYTVAYHEQRNAYYIEIVDEDGEYVGIL